MTECNFKHRLTIVKPYLVYTEYNSNLITKTSHRIVHSFLTSESSGMRLLHAFQA